MHFFKIFSLFLAASSLLVAQSELRADDSTALDYDHIAAEFGSSRDKSEAVSVTDLAGVWTLIARRSRETSPMISSYPDGGDSAGLKNQDGSLPTLVFTAGVPSACAKPFGFQIASWGMKDNNLSASDGCGSKIAFDLDAYHGNSFSCPSGVATSKDILKCKVFDHGKQIKTPLSAFPFGFPLTTECLLFPPAASHHDPRLGCLIQKSGNSGDHIYVGALLFEQKPSQPTVSQSQKTTVILCDGL